VVGSLERRPAGLGDGPRQSAGRAGSHAWSAGGRPCAHVQASQHEGAAAAKDGTLRALFMFDPRRQVILLLGGDKSGQWNDWYRWAVPAADGLYDVYLDELRREGLI